MIIFLNVVIAGVLITLGFFGGKRQQEFHRLEASGANPAIYLGGKGYWALACPSLVLVFFGYYRETGEKYSKGLLIIVFLVAVVVAYRLFDDDETIAAQADWFGFVREIAQAEGLTVTEADCLLLSDVAGFSIKVGAVPQNLDQKAANFNSISRMHGFGEWDWFYDHPSARLVAVQTENHFISDTMGSTEYPQSSEYFNPDTDF